MYLTGILVGAISFAVIGMFHPIVIKTEYHWGKRMWPLFLVAGIAACAGAVMIANTVLSCLLAVVGFAAFWSIKELFEQETRVANGWFPANPKREQPSAHAQDSPQ
ncbi:MAG: DUF4491 family protein [Oscillospiraceae bacterium]|nr:DUF4491 family protein [Oscillospiraceae bacterium]